MNTINWKQKLSSRKFWALISALILSILVYFNVGENQIAQIATIMTAFGSTVVYMLAETSIDKAKISDNVVEFEEEDEEE